MKRPTAAHARCFKGGLGDLGGGLGGCETSIKRKWAREGERGGRSQVEKEEMGGGGGKERERGKLIFKRALLRGTERLGTG